MNKTTPMMEQYHKIKKENKDTILFYRVGDFYETFGEDAKITSRELEITLTTRNKVPLAGVPYHAVENYITRLVKKKYKVAICDQMEDAKLTKGIVKREVVRIVTPGTVLDPTILENNNNFLLAINKQDTKIGVSFVDISTGEFILTQFQEETKLVTELTRLNPAECLLPQSLYEEENFLKMLKENRSMVLDSREDWIFNPDFAYQKLLDHFGVHSLEGFGCETMPLAYSAAGAIIHYLEETQKRVLPHISCLTTYSLEDYMLLGPSTLRNLELTCSLQDSSLKGTLLWVLDETFTAMGKRLLQKWIKQPLLDLQNIIARQGAVEELLKEEEKRSNLREDLKGLYDIERLMGRVGCGTANARDLLSLGKSLEILPYVKKELTSVKSQLLKALRINLRDLSKIPCLIEKAIKEEPPYSLREGGLIKAGYNKALDELRSIASSGKDWIANLEALEKKRTKINSLKVKFNKVFGYYIEITKSKLSLVPDNYMRKQTLVNAERFVTPKLQEYESRILGAEEKIINLEYEIFTEVRDKVAGEIENIKKSAESIATLDVLLSFVEVARNNNYVKPEINENDKIIIKEGRHPVVEKMAERFIPNDIYLDCAENQLIILTGPNMAGKSTYLRQIALIVLMGQIGSFVPAKSASLGIVDRIFTRVGALDNLIRGQSTFMIEMNETANILNNATKRSLIILDEIGRGTSTYDGVSIAWAVAEYIHNENRIGAKTLFATHYHELCELAQILPRVKNYNIAVREWNEEIIFLYKVLEGGTDHSYGIQVARLAGLPKKVIERAKEILNELENITPAEKKETPQQMSLFMERTHSVIEEIKKLDIMEMSPLEALNKLQGWKEKVND